MRELSANPDDEWRAARVAEAPTIQSDQQFLYWQAFQELGTERQIGMSIGPIPLSKVWEWAHHMNLTHSEARALVYVVRELDSEYLSITAKRSNSNSKPSRKQK